MSTQDPFDRVRKSNPVDSKDLPGAPLGLANRIMTEGKQRRYRITGPALGLASMAFVLVIGALTTTIMLGGSDTTVATQATSTTVGGSSTSTTSGGTTTVTRFDDAIAGGIAPWSALPLSQSAVPQHLLDDWAQAQNQTWCSALYPADPAALSSGAISRSADFSGGWAVAWDLPDGPGRSATSGYCPDCGRSAFGIAGTDLTSHVDDLSIWPNQITWDDGSRAGYGLEGLAAPGSGAPALSYVVVEGQGCLYNVWSFLGEDHLRALLDSLRLVEGMQAEPVQLVDRANQVTRDMGEAPWSQPGLLEAAIPPAFLEEWDQDLGTTACPLMAFADVGPEAGAATARRGNGDGALIVAWDRSNGPGRYETGEYCADCGRGAFGTSLEPLGDVPDRRTDGNPSLRFEDGSKAWTFPELSFDLPADRIVHVDPETGAAAPEAYRAFVEVAGEPDCVYQVWSSLGPDHVEYLVSQMRFVER
jgi:hypothetical protein